MTQTNWRKDAKRMYKESPRRMGVYEVKNLVNGKRLIGVSTNIDAIFNRHRFELRLGCHRNQALQEEWSRYGEERFAFAILEVWKPQEDGQRPTPKELEALCAKWRERLRPDEEYGYQKLSGRS